ncbi:MAG: hypothetical protein V9G19_09350 [Tetrasphaera sp.]
MCDGPKLRADTRITGRLMAALGRLPPHPPAGYAGAPGWVGLDGLLADPQVQAIGADATRLTLGLAAWDMIMGAVTAEVFEQFGTEAFAEPEAHVEEIVALATAVLAGTDASARAP